MRVVFFMLALCGCAKHVEAQHEASAEPPVTTATAPAPVTASARQPAAASFACGSKTCESTQYCVHMTMGRGTAYNCWSSLDVQGGGITCGAPDENRHVVCKAAIPPPK